MVVESGQKLIRHLGGPRDGFEEFYDLHEDPIERTNIAAHADKQVLESRKRLDAFREAASEAATRVPKEQIEKMDRDTENALRALGYIR